MSTDAIADEFSRSLLCAGVAEIDVPTRRGAMHSPDASLSHHHAALGRAADERLLRSAGARVIVIGGCCGPSGNLGVERGHHEATIAGRAER